MTPKNVRKVLSLAFVAVICLSVYAFLGQCLTRYNTGVLLYHGVLSALFSGNESNRPTSDMSDESNRVDWWRHATPSLVTEQTVTFTRNAKKGTTEGHHMDHITLLPIMYKEAFKKMPEWDFDDNYNRGPHFKQTSCPESLRNNADLEFKKAFIPDIQLFMQQGDLNRSEWNRLSHFNNPFGFMEYKYSEVKKAVNLIPKLKNLQFLSVPKSGCIRCAVVGTSGILNGSRMGQEIDSHDYVFRMNGAVIKGYEEDVGTKTSVYVHTSYSLMVSVNTLQNYGFTSIPKDEGIKYVLIPEGLRDFQWLHGLLRKKPVSTLLDMNTKPWTFYPDVLDWNRFYVLHPDFLRYVKNRFMKSAQLETSSWHFYRPTNGAFTLFLALHTCDVVDAYGFITVDHSKYSNYYFEMLKKTAVVFYINHDYNLEIRLWKKLNDAKVIRLYQREEDKEKNAHEKLKLQKLVPAK